MLAPILPGPPGHDRVTGGARGRFGCAGGTGGAGGTGQGARGDSLRCSWKIPANIYLLGGDWNMNLEHE